MKWRYIILLIVVMSTATGCACALVETPAPNLTPPPIETPAPAPAPMPVPKPVPHPIPESYQLNVAPICSSLELMNMPLELPCYLGSFAMLARYYSPELEFFDVVAYSGLATAACYVARPGGERILVDCLHDFSLVYAARNLGFSYVYGVSEEYPYGSWFKNNAQEVITFRSVDDALSRLKEEIALGHPLEVLTNFYYTHDDLALASDYWRDKVKKGHYGEFVVVTGYDRDHIYLNSPTDPTTGATNMPAKVDNFKLAWQRTNEIMEGANSPLNMIYLSEIGGQKSAEEIIAWNVELGTGAWPELRKFSSAPEEIRKFAANPTDYGWLLTGEKFCALARVRLEFGNFLEKNGRKEAAALYKQSGRLFAGQVKSGPAAKDLLKIADVEEQALKLLSKP